MLDVGGVLAFDDIGYPPVQKVGLGLGPGLGLGLPTRVPRPPTLSPCCYASRHPSQALAAESSETALPSSPDPNPTTPLLTPCYP